MGITERKERDRTKMRKLITDAARKIFLHEDYETVSIRAIADKIEYSPATIYLYFKDKDEIFYAVHNEGFEKLIELLRAASTTKDPLERLRKLGRAYVRFALENPELYDLMFIMRGPAKKIEIQQEWKLGQCAYDILRENVKACLDAKLIPAGDLEVATFAFWSMVHGPVSLVIRGRCVMIPEEHIGKTVDAAVSYTFSMV